MNKVLCRCPECKSTNVYYRVRHQEYVCRRCGFVWRAVTDFKEVKK